MDSEETLLSKVIRTMESVIMADNKVDMVECGILLRLVRPLADNYGSDFRAFEEAIREVREDGVVTPEESDRLRRLIAAMADRADEYKVTKCPECQRPLSIRVTETDGTKCPWCGREVKI